MEVHCFTIKQSLDKNHNTGKEEDNRVTVHFGSSVTIDRTHPKAMNSSCSRNTGSQQRVIAEEKFWASKWWLNGSITFRLQHPFLSCHYCVSSISVIFIHMTAWEPRSRVWDAAFGTTLDALMTSLSKNQLRYHWKENSIYLSLGFRQVRKDCITQLYLSYQK